MASTRTHHRKLTRKQLKQPDEFQSFFENTRAFILENINQVILSAVIILVAAGVAVGTYVYERHRDNLAADQFYAAMTALNQKDYKQAEQRLTQLAQEEPGREVGRLARFYLATSYLQQNDLKRARDALVDYRAESHDPIFTNFALANLGLVYERLGEFGKAEKAYSQAAGVPGSEQSMAELGAARMLLKQGKTREAVKAYRNFLQAHPFSPQRPAVIETLALLGATPSPAATERGASPQPAAAPAAVRSSKP